MEYQEYIAQKKEFSDNFYQIIENENSSEDDFQNFIEFIKSKQYEENKDEFKLILHMINNISNNHYRYPGFLSKFEQFFAFYSKYIKENFTSYELFNIFQNNKRILLYLIENKMIYVDEIIAKIILKKDEVSSVYIKPFTRSGNAKNKKIQNYFIENENLDKNYSYYFFPEIKQFLGEEQKIKIEAKIKEMDENIFNENRHAGENEDYLCKLIREDLIEEFDFYVNKSCLQLSSQIKVSIFETHPLLFRKQTTLIEYAAFYGSIQIFQYLRLKQVCLKPSIWRYAIHGNNPEIIHLIEESHIKLEDDDYIKIIEESIKCHDNKIANYILDNFDHQILKITENNFTENQFSFGFHYHNYEFIQNFTNYQFIFYYACLYDYFSIVKLLIKLNLIDLNLKVIQIFFLI